MFLFLSFRQAEDAKRDEQDAQNLAAGNQPLTFDDESTYNMNGKLLENNYTTENDETASLCSCTCMGGTRCLNHEQFVDPDFQPMDIIESTYCLKRASV